MSHKHKPVVKEAEMTVAFLSRMLGHPDMTKFPYIQQALVLVINAIRQGLGEQTPSHALRGPQQRDLPFPDPILGPGDRATGSH